MFEAKVAERKTHFMFNKFLSPLAWVSWNNLPTLAVAPSKLSIYYVDAVCTVFEFLLVGGETA